MDMIVLVKRDRGKSFEGSLERRGDRAVRKT
jgi:hypothetical protein